MLACSWGGPPGPGRQPAGRRAPPAADRRRAGRPSRNQLRAAVRGLGRAGAAARRDPALDLQLARLALLADDPEVAVTCAPGTVTALRGGPTAGAARLGQDAIDLLDRHGQAVPLALLRQTAAAALTGGDGPAGEALLDRTVQQAEAGDEHGTSPLDRARVIAEHADHLITRGELDQAGQLLRDAWQLFTAAGSEREATVVMGTIAASPTSEATTTKPCGSAKRSSCQPSSASAPPGKPPSSGARSPTFPTGAATAARRLSCSASGWR